MAALPTAGPVGLAIYIIAGRSMPLAVMCVALVGATGWLLVARRSPAAASELGRLARQGAAAGALATAAYDAARFGLIAVVQMSLSPFYVWQLFGRLFIGDDASGASAYLAGALFHLGNGMGLGAAYRLLVSRPTVLSGVVWAFALELAMALLYPRWLRMDALGEFLQVSVLGHAVYGVVLALGCRRASARQTAHGG